MVRYAKSKRSRRTKVYREQADVSDTIAYLEYIINLSGLIVVMFKPLFTFCGRLDKDVICARGYNRFERYPKALRQNVALMQRLKNSFFPIRSEALPYR